MEKLFASFSYYKLKAREHFIHYVLGSVEEVLNQALVIPRVFGGWKTMGKKSKLVVRASLRSS